MRSRITLVALLVLSVVASACSTSFAGPRSAGDDDCKSGYIMSGGHCVPDDGGGP